jgi:hypothetical protein
MCAPSDTSGNKIALINLPANPVLLLVPTANKINVYLAFLAAIYRMGYVWRMAPSTIQKQKQHKNATPTAYPAPTVHSPPALYVAPSEAIVQKWQYQGTASAKMGALIWVMESATMRNMLLSCK